MAKNELMLFSTGFYGQQIASSHAVISPFIEERVARLQYDSTIFNRNPKKTISLNKEVSDLHNAYMVNAGLFLRKFDNREAVIVQALRSFGTNFTQWYNKHAKDEKIDGVVFEFIEDTAKFILTGQRRYPVQAWKEMIEIKSGPHKGRVVHTYTTGLIGMTFNDVNPSKNTFTADVIQKWLSQKAGIVDMLLSMNIMFGAVRWTND